jgi:hypothetical protein
MYLYSPLGYSYSLFFSFLCVRNNILTSIILVAEEQLCHGRGDHVVIASYVTPFFSKNSPQKNQPTMMNTSSPSTTPLCKQQRNNETSTILR